MRRQSGVTHKRFSLQKTERPLVCYTCNLSLDKGILENSRVIFNSYNKKI